MNHDQASRGFRTPTGEDLAAVMTHGAITALKAHKAAGVAAVVWDQETGATVLVPPEAIPDFAAANEPTARSADDPRP